MVVELRRRATILVCPTLTVAELIAALSRATGDDALAHRVAVQFRALPGLSLVGLDEPLAWAAGHLASMNRLRDNEMLQRCAAAVPTLTPAAWLASI
jgi:hypothetical protein